MGLFRKQKDPPIPPVPPPGWTPPTAATAGLPQAGLVQNPSLLAHSAFVKRVRCVRCGAPKSLPSTTAYLYCDFCGALVDYDHRLANAGTNAGITNTVFHRLQAPHQAALAQARAVGDAATYREIQRLIYRQWLIECPQAASPRVRTDEAFREQMAAYCAESAVTKDLDPELAQIEAECNARIAALQRIPTPGGTWMVAGDFWGVAARWKHLMDLTYERMAARGVTAMDPDDPPPGVALKMEYSSFCQVWLPHLSPEDGQRLLTMYGLTGDYDEVAPQATEAHRCGGCGGPLTTVVGARVVVCEACGRQVDVGAGSLPCRSCGAALDLVHGTSHLDCPYCHTTTQRV